MVPELPLSSVTVIELSQYIAGPFCTKILAGMGAKVIKIEKPGVGDPTRRMGPFPGDIPDPEKSGTFLYLNTGKKGITLDLETATGIKMFKMLVRDADVVVENFQPGVMSKLGLSYKILEKVNPRLVITSISNFGQNGPYRDYKADEMTILALGGMMYITGDPDREPLRMGYSASHYMAGLAGFSGTLAALYHAEQTGIGQQVDISLMECIAASHFQATDQYSYTGFVLRRNRAMLGFPCKDGFIHLALQPHHWPRFAEMLGMNELIEDPRFANTQARRINSEELETLILPWMLERTMEEIYYAGQAVGLPIGYMASSQDLYNSPQYKARDFFINIDHPIAGTLTYPGAPVRMGDLPWQQGPAPLLGQHNEEIYCQGLGYTKEDLLRLKKKGII